MRGLRGFRGLGFRGFGVKGGLRGWRLRGFRGSKGLRVWKLEGSGIRVWDKSIKVRCWGLRVHVGLNTPCIPACLPLVSRE